MEDEMTDDTEDMIQNTGGLGRMQHNRGKASNRKDAYDKGKARHDQYQKDPSKAGGPKDDGYGGMSPDEKEAYKKGHRGE